MTASLAQISLFMLAGVAAVIFLTLKCKLHPFFALIVGCLITGLGVELPFAEILKLMKTGIGDVLSKLTLLIVLGTAIGVLLERNGCTQIMADSILKLVGARRSPLALSITGFVVGLPIFCDSGYIVLNGINQRLTRLTSFSVAQMSISLASGLYAVHCLLPPHPGASAAAGSLGVDFGKIILYGIPIAIPAMLVGYAWALYAGKKTSISLSEKIADNIEEAPHQRKIPAAVAFLPILVPILLMSLKSVLQFETNDLSMVADIINVIGDPSVALGIGLIITIFISIGDPELSANLSSAVEKASGILIIIAAGGAFGLILMSTGIGEKLSRVMNVSAAGLFFPFILTAVMKTAQGSSTVAIVISSSIIVPLLPALGLDSENGKLLAVLAMGAGSMMISHANDAYFWVISKFSSIDVKTMLRVHSVASIWMGLITMLVVYLVSLIIL